MEYARDIVVAMLQYGYLTKTDDNDKNIETVKKALDEIYKQAQQSHRDRNK